MNAHAAVGQPGPHAAVDQLLQRHSRQQQRVGFTRGQEPIDEDLPRGRQRGPLGRFPQPAEDDRRPKPGHHPRRLPRAANPCPDRLLGLILAGPRPGQPRQSAHGLPSLAEREVPLPQHGRQQVQRGGQPGGRGEVAPRAVGTEEMQRRAAPEAFGHAQAAAEVDQVGAAAHRHVLARIDELPGLPVAEGSGPSAESGGLLEQFHAAAMLGGRGRGAEPGQPAADNGNGDDGGSIRVGIHGGPWGDVNYVRAAIRGGSNAQRRAIRSFFGPLRRIRRRNTSSGRRAIFLNKA